MQEKIDAQRERRQLKRVLGYTLKLLETKGWVKGRLASNKDGYVVEPESEDACRFCVTGAFIRTKNDLKYIPWYVHNLAASRIEEIMGGFIENMNDLKSTTYGQILMTFDLAICGAGKR